MALAGCGGDRVREPQLSDCHTPPLPVQPASTGTLKPTANKTRDDSLISLPAGVDRASAPLGWTPYSFAEIERKTRYEAIRGPRGVELHAHAARAAQAMRLPITIDPNRHPRLTWSWRIDKTVAGDVDDRARDDYAIRVMLLYRYDPSRATFSERMRFRMAKLRGKGTPPYRILCYVWSHPGDHPRISPSPVAKEVAIVSLRRGNQAAGRWVDESVDHLADFRAAFGIEPTPIESVVVMSDTDDTGSEARAAIRALRSHALAVPGR